MLKTKPPPDLIPLSTGCLIILSAILGWPVDSVLLVYNFSIYSIYFFAPGLILAKASYYLKVLPSDCEDC